MDAPTAAFLSALDRSRGLEGKYAATLADVNAACELLKVEARSNERLRRSATYDGLCADAAVLARIPAADPQRQPGLALLFQQLVVLMQSHAPRLLMPRHFWSTATSWPPRASSVPPISGPLATFPLASGTSLALGDAPLEDAQALGEFFNGLSSASFQARFPSQACRRDELATRIVLDARHPMPELRHVTLVLRDEAGRIVGLLDYHQRPESMMRHAVATAQAAGQLLPRPGLKTCEFNVVIADALQGQGLAPRLLESGMAHARRAGYQQLVAVVATANRPMQRCLAQMGASAAVPLLDRGYALHVLKPPALMA